MNQMSLSRVVLSKPGVLAKRDPLADRLVTFKRAAYITQTSITVLERLDWEKSLYFLFPNRLLWEKCINKMGVKNSYR